MSRRVTYIENSGVSERHPSLDVTRKDQRSMRVSFSDFMSRAYVKASTLSRVRPFSVKISIERESEAEWFPLHSPTVGNGSCREGGERAKKEQK